MENKYSDDFRFQELLRLKIAGELEGEALDPLNREIGESPDAANEAGFSSKLSLALRYEDQFKVNALIKAIIASEGLPPAAPVNGGAWGGKWGWFIGLTLLGLITYQLAQTYISARVAQRYERYITPLENVIITPENPSGLADLDQGMAAYDRGDYARAAELLDKFYRQTGDPNAGLFLGVARLQQGDHKAALIPLQNSMRSLQAPALDACRWYLALAYLQDKTPGLASNVLRLIPADSAYGDQAQELLEVIAGTK